MKVVSVETGKSSYSAGETVSVTAVVERGLESGGWVDLYIISNRNRKWSNVADVYVGATGIIPNLLGIGGQNTVKFTVAIPSDVDDATFTVGAVARGSDKTFTAANTATFEVVGKTIISLNTGYIRFKSNLSGVSGAVAYVDGSPVGLFDVIGVTDFIKLPVGTHTIVVSGDGLYSDIISFTVESGVKRVQPVDVKQGNPGLLSGVEDVYLYAAGAGVLLGLVACGVMLSRPPSTGRYGV